MSSGLKDVQPTAGARPPRAWFQSDAPATDLSGDWRFRLSGRADADTGFVAGDFDDSAKGVEAAKNDLAFQSLSC